MKLDVNNIDRIRGIIQAYDAYDTIAQTLGEYLIEKREYKSSDEYYKLAYKTLKNIIESLHTIPDRLVSEFDKKLAENPRSLEIETAIRKEIDECAETYAALVKKVEPYSDDAASVIGGINHQLSAKNISDSKSSIEQLYLRLETTYLHEPWYDYGKGNEIRNLCDNIVSYLSEYFNIVCAIVLECRDSLEI